MVEEEEESRMISVLLAQAAGNMELPFTDLEKTVGEASFVVKWPNWPPCFPYCSPSNLHTEASEVFLRHKSELSSSPLLLQVKWKDVGWMRACVPWWLLEPHSA